MRALQSYLAEAQDARRSGLNPRDDKWKQNLDLYWGRYDNSKKASWQASESMPEVPSYVDRFAAAMKEALVALPESFYTVVDPADQENNLAEAIKRVTDVWLTTVGRNQNGHVLDYSAVFEEQIKLGSIMSMAAVTTWKKDYGNPPPGRVAIETVDPQMVWLDHTYRNLYRIRRIELDMHELAGLKNMEDAKGLKIYDTDEMERLTQQVFQKADCRR